MQLDTQSLEQGHTSDALDEVEKDLSRLMYHESRTMHQFLQHVESPAPFGEMAGRIWLTGHAWLSHQLQDAVGQLDEVQDQFIGGELDRGQPLQAKTSLDIAVVLFVSGMRLMALIHQLPAPCPAIVEWWTRWRCDSVSHWRQVF